jgi:hypothetical protein
MTVTAIVDSLNCDIHRQGWLAMTTGNTAATKACGSEGGAVRFIQPAPDVNKYAERYRVGGINGVALAFIATRTDEIESASELEL